VLCSLPAGLSECTADSDCSHNGQCNMATKSCDCDLAWSGNPTCSQLALASVPFSTLGTIYPRAQNVTSWGGSVTYSSAGGVNGGGLWHLLVAEMDNHCGLRSWQSNSFIRHATSETIDGIYEPQERVLGVFSHNPSCFDASKSRLGGPECVLLHIGTGLHDSTKRPEQNCSRGYTPKSSQDGSKMPPFPRKLRDSALPSIIPVPVMDSFSAPGTSQCSSVEHQTCQTHNSHLPRRDMAVGKSHLRRGYGWVAEMPDRQPYGLGGRRRHYLDQLRPAWKPQSKRRERQLWVRSSKGR
jgi:hypothetical protein